MTDNDQILELAGDKPQREGGCPRRVAIWSAMIMCGLMIALILLSQPRVTAGLQNTSDYVSGRLDKLTASRRSAAGVVALPSSQLPVRRGGTPVD